MSKKETGLHILEIELTNKCNLNCAHCYVDRSLSKEMPKEKVCELIDDAADAEVTRLVFTGGEPLLSSNLFDYAQYARKKGIKSLFLLTNGLLINETNIEKLNLFDEIQISLDELPSTQPSIRKDYLKKLEKTFSLLRENNVFFLFFVTLNKKNYMDIEKFISYAKEQGANIAFNCLIPMHPELNNLTLSHKELYSSLTQLIEKQKLNSHVLCNHHFRFLIDREKRSDLLSLPKNRIVGGCLAGIAAAYVCVNGDVYGCPFLKVSAGNVFEKKFFDIWENSSIFNSIRNRWGYTGACGKCQFVNMCGGCRAVSYIKNGSITGSDINCIKGISNVD